MDEHYNTVKEMPETSSSEGEERNANQARTQRRWPRVIMRRRKRYSRASSNIDIRQLRATNSLYLSTPYFLAERGLRYQTAITNTLRVLSDSIIDEEMWNLHLLASVVCEFKYMEVNYDPDLRERRRVCRTERQIADAERPAEADAEEAREEGNPGNEAHSVPGHRQFDSDDANAPYPHYKTR